MGATAARIESVSTRAYVIPTEQPETGPFAWTSMTLILVEASAGGHLAA